MTAMRRALARFVIVSVSPDVIDERIIKEQSNILNYSKAMAVEFSSDGTRYAYAYRAGDECVVYCDGKELWRGPYFDGCVSGLRFSPGGKHVYFIHMPEPGNQEDGFRVVMDGQEQDISYLQPMPVFSMDDEHYAYNTTSIATREDHTLVVDGKPVAEGYVRLADDGQRHRVDVTLGHGELEPLEQEEAARSGAG